MEQPFSHRGTDVAQSQRQLHKLEAPIPPQTQLEASNPPSRPSTGTAINRKPLPQSPTNTLPNHNTEIASHPSPPLATYSADIEKKALPRTATTATVSTTVSDRAFEAGQIYSLHSRTHNGATKEHTSSPSLPFRPSHARTNPFTTLYHRLRHRYSLLSKRKKRLVLLSAALAFIVLLLVIILPATLVRKSRFTNLPLPSNHGGPYTGELTYYDPALGSCGITSTGEDYIVAVSHLLYDAVSTGSNPNANPLCGKKIRARRGGKSVDLTVVDRCTGCKAVDLDVTRTVFKGLADIDQGRVEVSWAWLEDVPGSAT